MLAERVVRGDLPPVAQRLPEEPAVIQPIHSLGKYGGTWRRLSIADPSLTGLNGRLAYEPLVRWDPTGTKVVPGLAKSASTVPTGSLAKAALVGAKSV